MRAPFPYFGGKASIADTVWSALGQPAHFLEPFFGSGAVLLARPGYDPSSHVESVCDADGYIANVWRAIRADPDGVAALCDWPVNHADLIARKKKLIAEGASLLERLCADETYYDTTLAGYWIWAASCWIGSGLTRPGQIPHLSDSGKGLHAIGQVPHVGNSGMGVHAIGKRPHVSTAGMDSSTDPRDRLRAPYTPVLYDWMRALAERLRRVRVVCGDWSRVCGGNWQINMGTVGVFFDPPYGVEAGRDPDLYHVESATVAADVREWAMARGSDPACRIVLAGYREEHVELISYGWREIRWTTGGGYANKKSDGMGSHSPNRKRETLFLSPHCVEMPLFARTP